MTDMNKGYCRYHFNFVRLYAGFEEAYRSLQRIFK